MLEIKKNFSLSKFNSFQLNHTAEYFCEVLSIEDCYEAIDFASNKSLNIYILGEGTNIVFSQNYKGLVIKTAIKGISAINNLVSIASGESWHESVLWTLKNNLYGLENLSLIPGNVGAAPVQNIGAYGKELSSFIHSVKVINLKSKKIEDLSKLECKFGYRDSIFKKSNNYLILEVTLKLLSKEVVDVSYKSLADYMIAEGLDLSKATSNQICRCVCELRSNILPNPKTTPNVGSFFKNVVLTIEEYEKLNKILKIPYYLDESGGYKISSAFLIEKAGWKGYQGKNVSVSDLHSLVILSNGKATGKEILSLANSIVNDVLKKFNINLAIEPSVI